MAAKDQITKDWFYKNIDPMLAVKGKPFSSSDYLYEIKWDGTRCIAFVDVDENRLRLQNRRFLDIKYRYPEFRFHEQFSKSVVLDGEIVVLHNGRSDFRLLQKREQIENRAKIRILSSMYPAVYVVFDILWDGEWIMDLPLIERKKILSELTDTAENLMISDYILGEGTEFYKKAIELGFEGIMAKKLESPYILGRSDYWIKIKRKNTIDAVIIGYMSGEGVREQHFGSLLLGLYDGSDLIYIGRVGTGFDSEFLEYFAKRIKKLVVDRLSIKNFEEIEMVRRDVGLIKPYYVAEVEFLEVTNELKLRAPVFKRLRLDKDPKDCRIDQLRDG
ncbi:DNA polymerase LigD, ligase domain protein [Archaeoglobus sulfaticallidus PM70-1]|uniref:DNA polymerase LigD, ligase domain protein n=1 Tax=Archaeoglobus sulfaticallidus PM70-1 TaxID=387631 RepID=N0BMR8_9EURY|nr:non-homologous end-joining DNA ligase [Archaeoglobus sulfaticallidus]AGK61545.1 DNA polymerase LigD, ligase domain protein [Archaeoglobus sulfaticallidus PM70-1]